LTPAQIIQPFSRALDECRFFPPPATLRELSGQTMTGDAVASEARTELFRIVAAMRIPQPKGHGPKLKDIPGRVLYGTAEKPLDENG
jgi:hypothetical protein